MNNTNEQFVEPSDTEKVFEKMLGTKVILTDSYQALVNDLQSQNQQLTEKLISVMEENAKLREQLNQRETQLYSPTSYKDVRPEDRVHNLELPVLPARGAYLSDHHNHLSNSVVVQPVPATYRDANGQMKYIPDLYANQREEESNTKKLRNALLNYASPL